MTRAPLRLSAALVLYSFLCRTPGVASVSAQPGPASCEAQVLTLDEAAALLRIGPAELARLAEEGGVPARLIGASWRFGCEALMVWVAGDEAPTGIEGARLTGPELDAVSATGTRRNGQARAATDAGQTPIGEEPEERSAEDVFLRGQRVLLGRGDVVVEIGQFYSRVDEQQLLAVGAGVGLGTFQQEAFTTLFQGRVGVVDETELFGSASLVNLDSHQLLGDTPLASSGRTGFGAGRLGVRRTLLREGPGRPDVIATFNGLIPGSGSPYGVGGGLVLVKSIDPVVLFAGGNYLHSFRRDLEGGTRLGPAETVDVSVGYGLALNDTIAVSMAASGLFARTAIIDDVALRQPDSFSGSFGLTAWLAEGLYIEPSVAFSLSGPGRGFAFGLTVPYAF
jgi:hypothetical protein